MTTNHIIFHEVKPGVACPDGIMAAAVTYHYLKLTYPTISDTIRFQGDSYRHADDYEAIPNFEQYPFKKGNRVFIVDFSYPASWLKYWESQGAIVTVIDHHAPKFPMLEDFQGAILDKNECGASLCWKHFFSDVPIPELLTHVRRRDIGTDGYYDSKTPGSEIVTEGLSKFRHNMKDADTATIVHGLLALLLADISGNEDFGHGTNFAYSLGKPKIEKRDRVVDAVCTRAAFSSLAGYWVPRVQTKPDEDRYVSQIGNKLCKLFPDAPFAWVMTSDGSSSLRSAFGFDVAKIAEQMGGGGHSAAAGFRPQKTNA